MRKHILSAVVSTVLLASSALAGKQYIPPQMAPPPEMEAPFGTRFYFAGQGGVTIENEQGDVGGFGGIKAGYVFGTGKIRPAVEADLYYNYIRVGAEDGKTEDATKLHTGAFMANFLVRFSMGRFQPYLGGGIGGYYASVDEGQIIVDDKKITRDEDGGGFAWQLIAGADYYFTHRVSVFTEYKFLNYEDLSATPDEDRLAQHLIALGVRIHF